MIQEEIKRIGKIYGLNPKFNKNGELNKKSYKEFQDKVAWYNISWEQILSEEFIEKFQDKVIWYHISWGQTLSEEFIEKFQDKVYWDYISYYQKLSGGFIRKFYHKIDFNELFKNKNISEEIKNKYKLIKNVIES